MARITDLGRRLGDGDLSAEEQRDYADMLDYRSRLLGDGELRTDDYERREDRDVGRG